MRPVKQRLAWWNFFQLTIGIAVAKAFIHNFCKPSKPWSSKSCATLRRLHRPKQEVEKPASQSSSYFRFSIPPKVSSPSFHAPWATGFFPLVFSRLHSWTDHPDIHDAAVAAAAALPSLSQSLSLASYYLPVFLIIQYTLVQFKLNLNRRSIQSGLVSHSPESNPI